MNKINALSQAIGMLRRYKKVVGAFAVILIFLLVSAVASPLARSTSDGNQFANKLAESDSEFVFTTIAPELTSGSSAVILLGTVLSNETANIYPRRDGIIEDIYVDIGDPVRKGQVVALLLPKGVEGQSAAAIAEKKARKAQAEADYVNAQYVKEQAVSTAEQKIEEKKTELLVAKQEAEALLEEFSKKERDITQQQDQAFTAASSARQLIERTLFGSNARTGIQYGEDDMLSSLGLLSSNGSTRYEAATAFNSLYQSEQNFSDRSSIPYLLEKALTSLHTTKRVLETTPSSPNASTFDKFSHAGLATALQNIQTSENSVLKAKENLEDAEEAFKTLSRMEPNVYEAYKSGNTTSIESNKMSMLEEQIASAENSVELTQVSQDLLVEKQQNMIAVADAQLNAEYAMSGHRQILSPFSGVVSKRFVDVGQIVMPSKSAFELIDVPTSLAKKAKAEVQFGLPENLQNAVEIGSTITFFLQADESQPYTAEVTRKSPQVDMQSHTVTVQAKIPDELDLPHQSSVRIRITDESTPVYKVPSSAVKREDDRNYVWILSAKNSLPVQQAVSVLSEEGEFAEITGLESTDTQIILDPPDLFPTIDS